MYRVINLNILISNMWQNDSKCWKQKFSIWSSDRKIKKIILRFIWFKEVHIVKCPTIYCIIFYFPLYPYQNLKILMMSFKMIKTLLTWQVCNSRFFEYIIFLCLIKVYRWSLSYFIKKFKEDLIVKLFTTGPLYVDLLFTSKESVRV